MKDHCSVLRVSGSLCQDAAVKQNRISDQQDRSSNRTHPASSALLQGVKIMPMSAPNLTAFNPTKHMHAQGSNTHRCIDDAQLALGFLQYHLHQIAGARAIPNLQVSAHCLRQGTLLDHLHMPTHKGASDAELLCGHDLQDLL